jgi:predicted nucleic acid-binding protein
MYVESDFLLALARSDEWLAGAAEDAFERHRDDLWTSHYTLVELLVVAYREGHDAESVVVNAKNLVEVRGDAETVLAAASYVEEEGLTPFDALHVASSGADPVVSSDTVYDDVPDDLPFDPSP